MFQGQSECVCNSAEGTKLLKKIYDSPISQLIKNIFRFKPSTHYNDVILYTIITSWEKKTLVYD